MKKVVITGLGVVTPVGNDVPTAWNSLLAGRHGIAPITRFDCSGFRATLAAEVKGFDPLVYQDKTEARRSDLYTQYAVAAACQAVEDSGISGQVDPRRLGVYFGSGTGGMTTFTQEHQKLLEGGPRRISPLFVPMMISNIAAGTIAIRFNAKGPCLPVVTACATGSTAVGEAFRAIRHGYADVIIAGGAEASIVPLAIAGFSNMTALSSATDPDLASLPFDERRGGFVMGEGAGALILEEYEHAKRRGARIYAQMAGYGSTCDAHHITAPDPEGSGAAQAIRDAVDQAGLPREGTIYVNAHGTGTPLNDVAETMAIKQALEGEIARTAVSSTKSMTGHMLGAAGAAEAVFSVLALYHGMLPPTIGLTQPDPQCDLDYVPLTARKAQVGLALSISLGFGGHNACVAFAKAEEE